MKDVVIKMVNIIKIITRWLTVIAALSIALILVINFMDIIGIKFFGVSIPGAVDITEELMVIMTLLPIAYVELERGHIRVTLLGKYMSPKVDFIINIFQYAIATIITTIITSRVFMHFLLTITKMQHKAGIDLPIWPSNLAVVLSFFVLTIVWLILLIRTLAAGIQD